MKKKQSEKSMKKTKAKTHNDAPMQAEYDFRNAVRGRAYRPLHKGYTLKIHKEDGTTGIQHFKIQGGTTSCLRQMFDLTSPILIQSITPCVHC